MLMREYAGSKFVKIDDVRNGPRREVIEEVALGKFGPVASFKSGCELTLNKTNTRRLINAFGEDSRDWIGAEVELCLGEVEYQGTTKPSVLCNPIAVSSEVRAEASAPTDATDNATPQPVKRAADDMNDEIPF